MVIQTKTMAEARELLRVSPPTLYRLINENKLKTYKVGRRRYTTTESINACIKTLELEMEVTV